MSDGRTYWDAEAEAKAKSENLYVLKQPVTKKFYVDGENNIDENCIDVGFQIFSIGAFEQYFKPLDVEALRQQIADIMDELGEYRDVEAYFRKQEESVAAVLRVCGLTQEETDV